MAQGDGTFELAVPTRYERLSNGLRVVLSPDRSAPIVTVAVYYHVGMRLEPRGRTGFAHLFEHLMFQGSEHLEKMELVRLVQESGGVLNGSTRYDFTNYFEVLPSQALELALWMEADRMRGPRITQAELDNQRDVVKNEIRVNVLNQPYGGYPWIDMAERAFQNWHNAHNGYGDMADLDAASLEDVRSFFDAYYSPSNAAVVVIGDIDPDATFETIAGLFEDIPAHPQPEPPDLGEPRQEAEQRSGKKDRLATRPALAVSYHTPERNTPEYLAMGLLDQVLAQGDDSILHRELVTRRGITSEVHGGINFLGHMHNAQTPLLWTAWLIHDADRTPDEILGVVDEAVEPVREQTLDEPVFRRALVKARADYYETMNDMFYPGFGRADRLASFALFDDDPGRINEVPARFDQVTPELVRETAREYLRRENRTILTLTPGEGTD